MKTLKKLALALATAAMIPATAHGFELLYGYGWDDDDAGYWISYSSTSDALAQPLTLQRWAIRDGANSWEDQSSADFDFAFLGMTGNASIAADYRNVVFFRNQYDPVAAARAYVFTSGGRITQFDIILYDSPHTWSVDNWHDGAIDIRGVIAHEFGHALGLGHSWAASTMFPGYHPNMRWLGDDDRDAAEYLY